MSLDLLAVFDHNEPVEWLTTVLAGHRISVARTIMSAMQSLQNGKVDVTLVQLHLQNESMFDLLRSVRRNEYYSSMSFICCATSKAQISSSQLDEFVDKSALMMGASRILQVHEFYSDSLEQFIFETLVRSDSVVKS